MSGSPYEVLELVVEPRLVAGVRAQVTRGRVGQAFFRHLDQVYAAAKAGAVSLDGQNIFIYRGCEGDQLTVDFCVGATAPFEATGAVEPFTTPSGRTTMVAHQGDYGGLPAANAAIHAWCQEHGRTLAGPSWEVYGHWYDDPALLRTEVYWLLAPG